MSAPIVASYVPVRCHCCGLEFLPVSWLQWRAAGYCSKECWPIKPEAVRRGQ